MENLGSHFRNRSGGIVMKAVVFHGIGKISLDDVDEPAIKFSTDAIIKITASAICGTACT